MEFRRSLFVVVIVVLLLVAHGWSGNPVRASGVTDDSDEFPVPSQSMLDVVLTMQGDERRMLEEMANIQKRLATLERVVYEREEGEESWIEAGTYQIRQVSPRTGSATFQVVYEQDDDYKWTLLQRRVDDSVHFNRAWIRYRDGFGILGAYTNFWLGLEKVYQLVVPGRRYLLRVDLVDWTGATAYAEYDNFTISGEEAGYRINYDYVGGTAGDSLDAENTAFSTKDRDHDVWIAGHCANLYGAGWWFKSCSHSNLNGQYQTPAADTPISRGITWQSWKGVDYSYRETTIKLRGIA